VEVPLIKTKAEWGFRRNVKISQDSNKDMLQGKIMKAVVIEDRDFC
jgi:hypothetical protein